MIKELLKNEDPKLVTENGKFIEIINHSKFSNSTTHWMGPKEIKEYHDLVSVYFHSFKKGQLVGRMNKSLTEIEGTGAFLNNKYEILISTFNSSGKPSGWTSTYLDCKETKLKYSFYDNQGGEQVYHEGSPL